MLALKLTRRKLSFLFFVLFDTEKGECASYYCPVLEEDEYLAKQFGPGQREIILDRRTFSGVPLFRIRTGTESTVVIRMDLAESLLERKIVGMELKEVRLTDGMVGDIKDRK